jgi:DNA-binding transcriptional LysR family regulator
VEGCRCCPGRVHGCRCNHPQQQQHHPHPPHPHPHPHPPRAPPHQIRERQAQQLVERMDALRAAVGAGHGLGGGERDVAAFLCGDFNAAPHDKPDYPALAVPKVSGGSGREGMISQDLTAGEDQESGQ